jgi:ATP-dependent Lhr-like helicase
MLGLDGQQVAAALASLEQEGFALRGRFTPTAHNEWCERRLLARIHRYTVKRLRAEIEPVAARDYLRFLFDWQRVSAEERMDGPEALGEVVEQLAGFEAPAAAWEKEILAARLSSYSAAWLDDACLAGRFAWARLTPINGKSESNARRAMPLKSTPISLMPRQHASIWDSVSFSGKCAPASGNGAKIMEFLRESGASFFHEIAEGTHLLRAQVEDALAELVALGQVSSDSFGGLRALLRPRSGRRRSRGSNRQLDGVGRWALAWPRRTTQAHGVPDKTECVEHVARSLLKRYGVVFLRMLEREPTCLPKWRELVRVYRQLEARGEIRGGRFVAGFAGEQFALPEAVTKLREVRRRDGQGEMISLSGADPLNLVGILTPGPKLPALAGNRVLYRDGLPIALLEGGAMRLLEILDSASEAELRMALLGHAQPAAHLRNVARSRAGEGCATGKEQSRSAQLTRSGHFAA